MDLYVPGTLKDQPVIIGGKDKKATYGEFQAEMDTFNRAFAEVMIEGDAKGRVFTFPIPTYNITKDFDWDNPNLEPFGR
jgi:anaerobic ribonucleoside-triphosphate reductase